MPGAEARNLGSEGAVHVSVARVAGGGRCMWMGQDLGGQGRAGTPQIENEILFLPASGIWRAGIIVHFMKKGEVCKVTSGDSGDSVPVSITSLRDIVPGRLLFGSQRDHRSILPEIQDSEWRVQQCLRAITFSKFYSH